MIALMIVILSGCGTSLPVIPIPSAPIVVPQPNPVPVPVPVPVPTGHHYFNVGEIVFVRNGYGMVCRGQIVNIMGPDQYLLNPVICNNHTFFYNVIMPSMALSR